MNTSKECLEMTENHVRGVKQEGLQEEEQWTLLCLVIS